MNLDKAIRTRRSVRKYKKRGVSNGIIRRILDLARYAPSSMNGQPWHFIVVRDRKTKKRLARIKNKYCPVEKKMFKADFMKDAAVVIVVCVDRKISFERGVESAVLATAYIMLSARARGLDSVYMSAYKNGEPAVAREIRKALSIPPGIDPVTMIPLGYPDEIPEDKETKLLEGMVSYETFGKK